MLGCAVHVHVNFVGWCWCCIVGCCCIGIIKAVNGGRCTIDACIIWIKLDGDVMMEGADADRTYYNVGNGVGWMETPTAAGDKIL